MLNATFTPPIFCSTPPYKPLWINIQGVGRGSIMKVNQERRNIVSTESQKNLKWANKILIQLC